MTVRTTGGKASEFRGRGLASGAWMGGRGRGRLKGHGVVRSGVNLDGVGVNPGESESSIFYYYCSCDRFSGIAPGICDICSSDNYSAEDMRYLLRR